MRVVAPYAAGNKDSLANRLMIHMQVHREALASGAPFVQIDDTYELAKMLAAATDVPGDRIYTDPATVEPPQPGPDYTMLALEAENAKTAQKEQEAVRENETKQLELTLQAETDKYKADKQSETQITVTAMKEGQNLNLEAARALLKDMPTDTLDVLKGTGELGDMVNAAIEEMRRSLQQFREQAMAPVKIVRRNGKIVGKEVNGTFVPIEEAS